MARSPGTSKGGSYDWNDHRILAAQGGERSMSERVHLKDGLGTVPLAACTNDGSGYKYVDEGGCPACGATREIYIREAGGHYDYEWKGTAERCVDYGEGCDHRIP